MVNKNHIQRILHSNSGVIMENVYTSNGYSNRKDYLNSLADDFGVDIETVNMIADLFGPNEDFDGLVTTLEDGVDIEL